MRIRTVAQRIDLPQAQELAKLDYPSLPERLFYLVFRSAYHPVSVLAAKLFYYPYYCCKLAEGIKRGNFPLRTVLYPIAIDGCFGTTTRLQGWPQADETDADPSLIAAETLNKEQLQKRAKDYGARKVTLKFKGPPDFSEISTWDKVYKPMFVCLCERKGKRFYRVIDAELGTREYFVEYKFPSITFIKPTQPLHAAKEDQEDTE